MDEIKKNQSIKQEAESSHSFETPSPKRTKGGWIITFIIIILIVLGGIWLISKYSRFDLPGVKNSTDKWQAVFLTNGQVYFGKVIKTTKDTLTLGEIYYLQVTQPLQRSSDQNQQQPAQNELALVKLGNELHGPEDRMYINKEHVLFTEILKNTSKVVTAIEESKKTQ